MAVVSAGLTNALDFRNLSIESWYYLTLTARTATYAAGDERYFGQPNYRVEFFGSGFTYDASGTPSGGTLTGFQESNNGALVVRVEGIALPVLQVLNWSYYNQTTQALAAGLAGSDIITGTPYNDHVQGYAGADTFSMGYGDDSVFGGPGNDAIDGGPGTDTVYLSGRASDYRIVVAPGVAAAVPIAGTALAAEGTDRFVNVERVQFTGTFELIQIGAPNFRPLDYIATYANLMDVFHADAAAGFTHFITYGAREGRTTTFSGNEYIASYSDLMTAFGTDSTAGTAHYIERGRWEHRTVGFHGLDYIASYNDLASAFGTNLDADAGAAHYLRAGRAEGRTVTFHGLDYIASYQDLSAAFGTNLQAGALHYIQRGKAEGRGVHFGGLEYIASHPDLIASLGADDDAGAGHYIQYGRSEGRAAALFNASQYLTNYADLRAAFGSDTQAATVHWISHGFAEGRTDHAPIA